MKKSKLIWLVFGLLIAAGGGFFWWRINLTAVEKGVAAGKQAFIVRKGETSSSVGQRLAKVGLIRSAPVLELFLFLKGMSGKIQAGTFYLSPSLKVEEISRVLTSRGAVDIWLTFPEGWRREEFGRRLAANLENFDYQEFVRASEKLEGALFPDTYLLPKEATVAAVLKIFQDNFQKKLPGGLEAKLSEKNLTLHQVLTFASIVEREAKTAEDRPKVAGILIKRRQNDWPLQADATIQHALGSEEDWWPEVKKEDLQLKSSFNTYKNKGLPPAPICNPGLASIEAVIDFEATDFWYYLSDKQGKIHYSRTIAEHQQKIMQFLTE